MSPPPSSFLHLSLEHRRRPRCRSTLRSCRGALPHRHLSAWHGKSGSSDATLRAPKLLSQGGAGRLTPNRGGGTGEHFAVRCTRTTPLMPHATSRPHKTTGAGHRRCVHVRNLRTAPRARESEQGEPNGSRKGRTNTTRSETRCIKKKQAPAIGLGLVRGLPLCAWLICISVRVRLRWPAPESEPCDGLPSDAKWSEDAATIHPE